MKWKIVITIYLHLIKFHKINTQAELMLLSKNIKLTRDMNL